MDTAADPHVRTSLTSTNTAGPPAYTPPPSTVYSPTPYPTSSLGLAAHATTARAPASVKRRTTGIDGRIQSDRQSPELSSLLSRARSEQEDDPPPPYQPPAGQPPSGHAYGQLQPAGYPPQPEYGTRRYVAASPSEQPQQQQQQQVFVVSPAEPQREVIVQHVHIQSFAGHIIGACLVCWCCNPCCGFVAFILAGQYAV